MSVFEKNIIMEIGSYIAGNGGYMSKDNDAYGKRRYQTISRRKTWY